MSSKISTHLVCAGVARALREHLGWTQGQAAIAYEVSINTVQRIETGERGIPLELWLTIARTSGLTFASSATLVEAVEAVARHRFTDCADFDLLSAPQRIALVRDIAAEELRRRDKPREKESDLDPEADRARR